MELYSISSTIYSNNITGAAGKGNGTTTPPTDSRKSPAKTEDRVTISQEGKDKSSTSRPDEIAQNPMSNQDAENLDREELKQLQQLKSRDTEVRTHEQAHLSTAGRYATGGATFSYQKGPDGGSYAIGGEVGIDTSKESTPEATITKMQTIKRAALAPADPSGADKQIAAKATAMEAQAREELLKTQQDELLRGVSTTPSPSEAKVATNNSDPKITTSIQRGLQTKLAAYAKMAAY